jgi:hypothetical protein
MAVAPLQVTTCNSRKKMREGYRGKEEWQISQVPSYQITKKIDCVISCHNAGLRH